MCHNFRAEKKEINIAEIVPIISNNIPVLFLHIAQKQSHSLIDFGYFESSINTIEILQLEVT